MLLRVGTGTAALALRWSFFPQSLHQRSPLGSVSHLSRKTSAFRVSLPNHKAVLSSLQAHCILSILATARTAALVIDTEPGTRSQKLKRISLQGRPVQQATLLEAQANPSLQASKDTPSLPRLISKPPKAVCSSG